MGRTAGGGQSARGSPPSVCSRSATARCASSPLCRSTAWGFPLPAPPPPLPTARRGQRGRLAASPLARGAAGRGTPALRGPQPPAGLGAGGAPTLLSTVSERSREAAHPAGPSTQRTARASCFSLSAGTGARFSSPPSPSPSSSERSGSGVPPPPAPPHHRRGQGSSLWGTKGTGTRGVPLAENSPKCAVEWGVGVIGRGPPATSSGGQPGWRPALAA